MSVVGLKPCPITGGLPTWMARASFQAMCRKKQKKSATTIHGPVPENPYCRECQGRRQPPELQFTTLATIKEDHQPHQKKEYPMNKPFPSQIDTAAVAALKLPHLSRFTLEHLSRCWSIPPLVGYHPGVCPACRQPGKRRAARGICAACYTALRTLAPGLIADEPPTTTTVSPSPEPPPQPAPPPAPAAHPSGEGEFSPVTDPDKQNTMANAITFVCMDLRDFLLAKNESYGDSASNPLRIFSQATTVEQINVRIDDKLSRLMRGKAYPGDDTELDLLGYLILKRAVIHHHRRAAKAPVPPSVPSGQGHETPNQCPGPHQ